MTRERAVTARDAAFITAVADVLDAAGDAVTAMGRDRLGVRHRFAAITVRDLITSPPAG